MSTDKPAPEQDVKTGRFVSGNVGGGRPVGSRNLLGEAFIEEFYEHWQKYGKTAIDTLYKKFPVEYVKVVASLLPKNLTVKISEVESWTDEELDTALAGRLLGHFEENTASTET